MAYAEPGDGGGGVTDELLVVLLQLLLRVEAVAVVRRVDRPVLSHASSGGFNRRLHAMVVGSLMKYLLDVLSSLFLAHYISLFSFIWDIVWDVAANV